MEMYIVVDKDLRDYDYQTGELREPYVIGNTYECNGRFQYLSNGFFGYPTLKDLFEAKRHMLRLLTMKFDETTGNPLPFPKDTDRILEVEMIEHKGFKPVSIPEKSMCMKIKVLREIHYNPDTFELTNEPNK